MCVNLIEFLLNHCILPQSIIIFVYLQYFELGVPGNKLCAHVQCIDTRKAMYQHIALSYDLLL